MQFTQSSFLREIIIQAFEKPEFVQEALSKDNKFKVLEKIRGLCKVTADKVDLFCHLIFDIYKNQSGSVTFFL